MSKAFGLEHSLDGFCDHVMTGHRADGGNTGNSVSPAVTWIFAVLGFTKKGCDPLPTPTENLEPYTCKGVRTLPKGVVRGCLRGLDLS